MRDDFRLIIKFNEIKLLSGCERREEEEGAKTFGRLQAEKNRKRKFDSQKIEMLTANLQTSKVKSQFDMRAEKIQ